MEEGGGRKWGNKMERGGPREAEMEKKEEYWKSGQEGGGKERRMRGNEGRRKISKRKAKGV